MTKYILGISAFYHDSAASIIKDGMIIAAAQEERFTRIKNDKSFPVNSILFCINYAKINLMQVKDIIFYDNSINSWERVVHNISIFDIFDLYKISKDTFNKKVLLHKYLQKFFKYKISNEQKIYFLDHHLSHASSAFYPSPFKQSCIITIDGVGEWATTTIGIGKGSKIKLLKKLDFPNSLGLIYSAFTSYCGFEVNSGEYKLMGLAPYGKPIYFNMLKNNILKKSFDGVYEINEFYFSFGKKKRMFNKNLISLIGFQPRKSSDDLNQKFLNLAASIQKLIEELILDICKYAKKITKQNNLCLAGGVALNCVANGLIVESKIFNNIWIQPAAGDAGGSLGSALYLSYNKYLNKRKYFDSMQNSFLGNNINNKDVKRYLDEKGINYELLNNNSLIKFISKEIQSNKIIGVCRGRMEFGPRALGNRSILADARNVRAQTHINLKVKFRESFRPFAAILLKDDAKKYFGFVKRSPYMLIVTKLIEKYRLKVSKKLNKNLINYLQQKRSEISAVTHVDYSTRLQIVEKNNRFIFDLLKDYKKNTGVGVLVNTSFNVKDEPIVSDIFDALNCFYNTEIDILVLGNAVIKK